MKGNCLCGAVTIEASNTGEFEACHCSMCRRWGGGPFLAVHCDSAISLAGNDSISIFESSDWAERAFCANCGSHLYYHLKPTDEYIVPIGLFPQQESFTFKQQLFIDKKPGYYEFANPTDNLTEKQVFEKFGG